MFLEERDVFFLKRFRSVVLHLVGDVFLDGITIGHAHRKRAITLLPREIFRANGFVNPARRGLFDVLHEFRKRMSRTQAGKDMNMVRCATDGFRNSPCCANQAAQVFVQPGTPWFGNPRLPVLRAEHDVVMQAQVRGGHAPESLGYEERIVNSQIRESQRRAIQALSAAPNRETTREISQARSAWNRRAWDTS